MNPSSSQRFDALAVNYAVSEVHTSSPTHARLHALLPRVKSVCDVASGAGTRAWDLLALPLESSRSILRRVCWRRSGSWRRNALLLLRQSRRLQSRFRCRRRHSIWSFVGWQRIIFLTFPKR